MRKKACKQCKVLVTSDTCPICKGNSFIQSWKGRVILLDKDKSWVAKTIDVDKNGEFAIKVR